MLKNFHMFCTSLLASLFFYFFLTQDSGLVSKSLVLDNFCLNLIFMTLVCLLSIIWMLWSVPNSNNFSYMNMGMLLIFIYLYMVHNFFMFYIMFELSVLPMMFYIASWGYSLDRIKAMMYMFMYTFFFSLPFLLISLYLCKFTSINTIKSSMAFNDTNLLLLTLSLTMFLVKVPMWGLHLWLPKAHVEASTEGSMILAGVVLKLAGIGLIKFSNLMCITQHSFMLFLYCSMTISGSFFMGMYCTRQSDAKVIIALSSIVHMSFLFICYLMNFNISFTAMILVMVAHGIISPLMFLFLGEVYNSMSSRSLPFLKGVLKSIMFLSSLWFILCMFNMGLPISMNFFGEIFFFFSTNSWSLIITFTMASLIFINGFFNSFLLIFLSGGKEKDIFYTQSSTNITLLMYMSVFFIIIFSSDILSM